jgi:hypothetical protein
MYKKSLLSLAVVVALSACSSDDDKNKAPSDLSLSNLTVAENSPAAVVGDITVTDEDSNETFTFSVSDERFEVVNSQLKLKADTQLDYEATQTIDLSITVTDSEEHSLSKNLTLEVTDVLDTYAFTNTSSNESSVSYSGQVARHLLILELNNYINSGLAADIANGDVTSRAEALEKMMTFYAPTSDDYLQKLGIMPLTTSVLDGLTKEQAVVTEVSGSLKSLKDKIAGEDEAGQHKDWATEFVAFGNKGSQSPHELIVSLLNELADNAESQLINGAARQDAFGNNIANYYVTTDGRDLKQLVQKTLLGAVTFSQGVDDYLDNTLEGKGLLANNSELNGTNSYTALEHQFDEGFGYFGAARDYLSYTDKEIAGKGDRDTHQGMFDTNADGMIDFKSEYNFGHSQNAAKRDLGTADNANPTDFTKEAMEAFLKGRQIIADADVSALTDEQMTALLAQRDIAVLAWEKSIASTAVHYINDTLKDYEKMGTDDFSYSDLAKHWSELKGFFVSLQFAPDSPLTDGDFETANGLIGDKPELNSELIADYKTDLEAARDLLQAAYGFDADNVTNW